MKTSTDPQTKQTDKRRKTRPKTPSERTRPQNPERAYANESPSLVCLITCEDASDALGDAAAVLGPPARRRARLEQAAQRAAPGLQDHHAHLLSHIPE